MSVRGLSAPMSFRGTSSPTRDTPDQRIEDALRDLVRALGREAAREAFHNLQEEKEAEDGADKA